MNYNKNLKEQMHLTGYMFYKQGNGDQIIECLE